jgi:hypothetical protein
MFLAVLPVASGCVPPTAPERPFDPPIVEWHASEQAYHLEANREDVVVWADGRIEGRLETGAAKRIVLMPSQMDRLFVLLSEVEFLQCHALDERLRVCPAGLRDPEVLRDVLLVYSPRPGLRRELRRSWGDGALEGIAFTPEAYARLESLDSFFRELLAKE